MIDYNSANATTNYNFREPDEIYRQVRYHGNNSNSTSSDPLYNYFCGDSYQPHNPETYFEIWMGCLITTVGVFGLIGNIISMIILSRPQMRSSINYLLIGLARYDTFLIITSILLFGLPTIYPYSGYMSYYYFQIYPRLSPITYPIGMIAQTASVYMTFIVTLERYIAVCHPLKARALCTYGRAKHYFIVCIIFSVLYNIPRFWEVGVVSFPIDEDVKRRNHISENVIYCVRATELRQDSSYINIYIHWCYLIVIYVLPFLNLAILNCLIYRQIKRANRERQRLSRSEQREISLATMLVCVVIVFFVFNFLACYLSILEAFYREIKNNLTKISNLLVTINSSANFIIYVIFGEKFKRICLQLFCKRKYNRDAPDLIHYESSISNGGGDGGGGTNRMSRKFSRHGTQRSTIVNFRTGNGVSATSAEFQTTTIPSKKKITRTRAPSPSPCVYYPARDIKRSTSINSSLIMSTHSLNGDWENNGKNAIVATSDF